MPSVSGKFTGIFFSSVTGGNNLLDGNTGNVSFDEGEQITYRSPAIPSVFSGATITGYSFDIGYSLSPGTEIRLLLLDQQSDGTVLDTGTLTTSIIGSSTQNYGGASNLLGLDWSGTVSDLSLNIALPFQAGNRDGSLILGDPGLTFTVHYTTTPTSKVYLSGGKVSITSGRVSIT